MGGDPTGSEPLTAATFDWNTETVADGYYRVRVTASDKRANPADTALSDTFVSAPILVDNQKPQVQGLAVKGLSATGRGVDSFSRIDEIAWQVDGGDWQVAAPNGRPVRQGRVVHLQAPRGPQARGATR